MPIARKNGPYIWVTWLTKLLVGENSCEWSSWWRTQHETWSWNKVPNDFDQTTWLMNHNEALKEMYDDLKAAGWAAVFSEKQNSFILRGVNAALGGKPDLIARSNGQGLIVDIKTGSASPAHAVQVMLYMYAVPIALGQYKGIAFDGLVQYRDNQVHIPANAIDDTFINNVAGLIKKLASPAPALKIPSAMECRLCDISAEHCAERIDGVIQGPGTTEDF